MIDIFCPDYQLKRMNERVAQRIAEAEKRTPEEQLEWLKLNGIIDENGELTPDYEVFKYIKWD